MIKSQVTPNSIRFMKVQRKALKPKESTKVKQRHLSETSKNKANMIFNLVKSFEQSLLKKIPSAMEVTLH